MSMHLNLILGGFLLGMVTLNCCKVMAQGERQVNKSTTQVLGPAKKKAPKLPKDKVVQKSVVPEVAPNSCRIIGKVIAISPEREANATNICGTTPCRAKVKIQKVLGYGHAFNQALAANQEINAYFVFSLQPTDNLLPDLTISLPGLKVGSLFQADITPSAEVAGTSVPWYQIKSYQVK